jgi:thiol-disulfide isomerase/thioredoxin
MPRTTSLWLAGVLLLLPGAARTAENDLRGNWKVFLQNQDSPTWLIKIEAKGDKVTGAILDAAEDWPKEGTIDQVSVSEDRVRFTLNLSGQEWSFEGKLTKDGTGPKIQGSIDLGGFRTFVARLESSNLKNLDPFELSKELLAKDSNSLEVFNAAMTVLRQASEKKAKLPEVRSWAEKVLKAAEAYGSRWQREMALRVALLLADQPDFMPVAETYARRAERLLDPQADADVQVHTLSTLAMVLRKAGKAAEAKATQGQISKLEVAAHETYSKKILPFKPAPGRNAKSDRVVLVELFTGTTCGPCVAADLAFDALAKTYKPSEVVLLQYHVHIPGPDPLTNRDTEARAKFYEAMGTPNAYFSGQPGAEGGGALGDSLGKYKEYRGVVDALLARAPKAKLQAAAVRKGDKIDITAEVADLNEVGETTRLRFALVEDWVRYNAPNGMRYHEKVVRALPGGPDGFALKNKTGKQTVAVDLAELRAALNKYLNDFAKDNEFPDERPALDFKRLHVVAFVQNDRTKEVLQAIQVEVQAGNSGQ